MSSTSGNSRSKKISEAAEAAVTAAVMTQEGAVRVSLRTAAGERGSYLITRADWGRIGSPERGQVLSAEETARLIRLAERRGAVARALNILAYGDNSRLNLRRKLIRSGCRREDADYAVDLMTRHNYIREDDAARRQAELCCKKGWSERKTLSFLFAHGYSQETARAAVAAAQADGTADFQANRESFIEKKRAEGKTPDEIRTALWRAGF